MRKKEKKNGIYITVRFMWARDLVTKASVEWENTMWYLNKTHQDFYEKFKKSHAVS